MTRPDDLNSVQSLKHETILTNAITECMRDNDMVFADLDRAYQQVRKLYLENATLRKAD